VRARLALWLKEQWFWCQTCNFSFPGSEVSSHKGHKYWPTGGTSE
jgi:hypothetical protein